MTDLYEFVVSYPNGTRRILAEDRIDAQERAMEKWGTAPVDAWRASDDR